MILLLRDPATPGADWIVLTAVLVLTTSLVLAEGHGGTWLRDLAAIAAEAKARGLD
ncbi:MAG: hypothetical protein WBA25_17780 [Jannaschia sp.]